MPFDYKKEYKEFYLPPAKPQLVHIPKMQFVSVRGKGNPNESDGEYQKELLKKKVWTAHVQNY